MSTPSRSTLEQARAAKDRAVDRRIHLCLRGSLDGLLRATACVGRLSRRLRNRLDPAGGQYDPIHGSLPQPRRASH